MALTVTSAFVGEASAKIYTKIFSDANSIKEGLFTIENSTAGSVYLQKTAVTGGITDYTYNFTSAGDVDLTEVVVTPKRLKFNHEIDKSRFLERWKGIEMGFSANLSEIPSSEKEALLLVISDSIRAQFESNLWTGATANAGEFNGFLTLAKADIAVVDVVYTAVTTANVLDQLALVVDAQSEDVKNHPSVKLAVASNVYTAYGRALDAANFSRDREQFEGFKLYKIAALPAGTIMMYPSDNVVFVTGVQDEENKIQILDMSDVTGDDAIRLKANWKGDMGIIDGADVVLHAAV